MKKEQYHELDEGLVEVFCPAFDGVGVLPLLSKPVRNF